MGVCVRYTRSHEEAMDLLNQGFLKILTGLDKYKEEVPFEAWIRRIMINTLIDDYRKHKKYHETHELTDFDQVGFEQMWVAINDGEKQLEADAIIALIQELPPMTRQVFNMYAIDGFSHKEIAKTLNISEGTSKWHVSAARKDLQRKVICLMEKEKSRYE